MVHPIAIGSSHLDPSLFIHSVEGLRVWLTLARLHLLAFRQEGIYNAWPFILVHPIVGLSIWTPYCLFCCLRRFEMVWDGFRLFQVVSSRFKLFQGDNSDSVVYSVDGSSDGHRISCFRGFKLFHIVPSYGWNAKPSLSPCLLVTLSPCYLVTFLVTRSVRAAYFSPMATPWVNECKKHMRPVRAI